MLYFSELGQNKELSIAELESVYDIKIIEQTNNALIFESEKAPDIEALGGTPKLGKILGEFRNTNEVKSAIIKDLKTNPIDKKVFFGVSFYGKDDPKQYKYLGLNIKKELKSIDYKVRWVVSQDMILSSVIVRTNKLLTRGGEYNLIFTSGVLPAEAGISSLKNKDFRLRGNDKRGQKIYLSKTTHAQNFSDYEFRDIRRPNRDLESGMTPTKLAKIMINLGSPPLDKGNLNNLSPLSKGGLRGVLDFLDPFCGSGTFLMEASLLQIPNVYGSDISEKAVNDSRINTKWLKEKYNITSDVEIKKCDVLKANNCWNKHFSLIVGEPYLGPPVRGQLSPREAIKIQSELQDNYNEYMPALASLLKKDGRLVLIVPFIIQKSENLNLNIDIKKYGLKSVREPINYSRENQKIGRKIYILQKL